VDTAKRAVEEGGPKRRWFPWIRAASAVLSSAAWVVAEEGGGGKEG